MGLLLSGCRIPLKATDELAWGFCDLLYQLNIGYNTPDGFAMAERAMGIIQDESHKTSQQLANEKGVFPNWHLSVFAEKGVRMRNAALTTVAPTGTIAM